MKRYVTSAFFGITLFVCSNAYGQSLSVTSCYESLDYNEDFSKANALQAALKQLTETGIPGVAMAVYSDEDWWMAAEGLVQIESGLPMQTCHLQYLQSIAKTYMAVAILKLYEQGKIDLDAPMTDYLPDSYSRYISDADKITVRMLLNHTSGIPEYNSVPAYVTRLLQRPDYLFSPEEYLKYISGKPLSFTPGSRYSYRNTNYVILALIADAITGDHAEYISKSIFKPLELK